MKHFENYTKEDLWALRQEIVLNSLFMGDYKNTFGVDVESCHSFFDGYVSYICEIAKEEGKYDDSNFTDILIDYDNADNLLAWYYCHTDFDWVKYDEDREKELLA